MDTNKRWASAWVPGSSLWDGVFVQYLQKHGNISKTILEGCESLALPNDTVQQLLVCLNLIQK
jgi:hypothetical protein